MITKAKLAYLFIPILFLFSATSVYAAESVFEFSLKRLTYDEGSRSVSIGLKNNENSPYLVQAGMKWLDESSGLQLIDKEENPPFIVTPLLKKIEPGEYYDWQIKFTGADNIPTDRESVYIAQFRLIPSTVNEKVNVQINVIRALNFKVYYRPNTLNDIKIKNVEDKLSLSIVGNKLIVKNNSPIYLAFHSIKINGKEIETQELSKNVPPLGSQEYYFTAERINKISWQVLDEYLFPLEEKTKYFK